MRLQPPLFFPGWFFLQFIIIIIIFVLFCKKKTKLSVELWTRTRTRNYETTCHTYNARPKTLIRRRFTLPDPFLLSPNHRLLPLRRDQISHGGTSLSSLPPFPPPKCLINLLLLLLPPASPSPVPSVAPSTAGAAPSPAAPAPLSSAYSSQNLPIFPISNPPSTLSKTSTQSSAPKSTTILPDEISPSSFLLLRRLTSRSSTSPPPQALSPLIPTPRILPSPISTRSTKRRSTAPRGSIQTIRRTPTPT